MAVEIPGTFRFDGGRAWFIFTHHGGHSVEFSAIESKAHLDIALKKMNEACIQAEIEATGGTNSDGESVGTETKRIEKVIKEAEVRYADMAKRAEDSMREQADRIMEKFGTSND